MKNTVLALIFLSLAACASGSKNVQKLDRLESVGEDPRIILMPPDIRYYVLTAAGMPEPHREWTEAAQAKFAEAALEYANGMGADLKILRKDNLGPEEIRYETLHSAVGLTVRTHYFGRNKLPGKGENFDWSLGPEINAIGENHNADYALFIHYRDYQATEARVAFAILAAASGIGSIDTGSESGFASLVDLKTGDIVWFNVVKAGKGEFRNRAGASRAVKGLFDEIPSR